MKNFKPFVKLLFILFWASSASLLHAQSFCQTVGGDGSIGTIPNSSGFSSNVDGPFFLKIYVHAVGKDNGSDAPAFEQIKQSIAYLKTDFATHGIFFVWDCNIIPINSTPLYNAGAFSGIECFLPQYSNHSDGIDVFIGGDNAPAFAAAYNIPSKFMLIKGPFNGGSGACTGIVEWVHSRSHIISHEMGHCLGLWHTHHGEETSSNLNCNGLPWDPQVCKEFVNGSNGFSCGDYVGDTPADPGLSPCYFDIYNDCVFQAGNWTDPNGTVYNPDETLIMSYTHEKCMTRHSEGQGARMRQIIATSPILQACLVKYAPIPLTITTNTTWTTANTPNNGNFNIAGDLTIEAGATLTIAKGVTVHFDVNSRVIVKPRGRLNLSGTLTGLGCDGLTWKGVEVWGVNKGSATTPGIFTGANSALVERAETAVKCYGPTYSMAGGRIICNGTAFKNNVRGVDIAPFQNIVAGSTYAYVGKFNDCRFLTDKDYPHAVPFEYFVRLNGITGVTVAGCEMLNTRLAQDADISHLGYGVKAEDASFSVGPGLANPVFNGLAYGVQTSRVLTGGAFSVTNATFDRCFTGVRALGVSNGTVLFNTFYMGNLPDGVPNERQYGVSFETDISGFVFEENGFLGEVGNVEETIGSACQNMGGFNNVVRRNYYSTLTYANLADGSNSGLTGGVPRGLTYECNFNSDINKYDITAVGSIRNKQGVEVDNNGIITYGAAGNYFSYGDGIDIQSSGAIEYFYNPGNFGEEPLTVQGPVFPKDALGNNCEQVYCYPDCSVQSATAPAILQAKQEYYGHESVYTTLMQQVSAPGRDAAAAYHLRRMDERAQKVLAAFLRDTANYQPDSVIYWIAKLRTPEADLWRATIQASKGNLSQAQQILTASTGAYSLTVEEQAHFSEYANLLAWLTNNGAWSTDSFSANILSALWSDAESENPHVRLLARNLLTRQGAHFPPEYLFPAEEAGGRNQDRAFVTASKTVTVRPNPARENATFEVNLSKGLPADLYIFDANGRLMVTFASVSAGTPVVWDTRSMVSGLYYYRVVSSGEAIASGKIFVNH